MGPTRAMAQGVYRIPKIAYDVAVALTNTTPVGAFRGAGRPEAAAFLERIMDLAADELGIDPVEIRRRNLLGPDVFPYTTLMGTTYDIGDYALPLERAVERAGYERLLAEQAERRAPGDRWQLGIGVSTYVEITAGGAASRVRLGEPSARTASSRSAPGPRPTARATPPRSPCSWPTACTSRSSRSATSSRTPTSCPAAAAPAARGRSRSAGPRCTPRPAPSSSSARRLAARLLEADEDDIVVGEDGRVGVAGVPARALTWAELAQAAARDDDGDGPLAAALDTAQDGATFPFGAHVAVVEVDLETGAVHHLRHVAVDDCGRIVNPLLVRGQQHGGIAQGVAQALWEQFVYDEDGNPITSTLAEYAMPSAAELPSFETENTETPTPLNPLGAKGIGESGTIGSMPAVQNAVVDALSHLGVRHLEMPCTPERVWRAINEAAGREQRLAVARTAGVLRHPARAGRPAHARRRRCRHLTSTSRPAAAAASPARWSGPAGAGPGRPRVRRWRRCSRTPRATRSSSPPRGCASRPRRRSGRTWSSTSEGSMATDFGVPGAVAAADAEPLTRAGATRLASLVAASWQVLDDVVAGAPATLRKGPRGGGRDRDAIATHVLEAEAAYARKLGLRWKAATLGDAATVAEHREAILDVLRRPSDGSRVVEKGWPPRYAARRIAWHALDHAWEIEDKSEPA